MKNPRIFRSLHLAAILLVSGIGLSIASRLHAQEDAVQELTRGPVHEAFAATVSFDPEPGITVGTAPPQLIDEIPPEQQPEGDNITWIPGYWGWDHEENDFIWISGVWRNVPPGRQWVPGYLLEADQEWQWISGYWEDGEMEETVYVSAPPKTLERGPSTQAPSNDHIWIPGNWVHREDDFAWQPGYWETGRQDWVWVPGHYQWTHRGYTYVDGYWDYEIDRRGVVFAPVRFQREVYTRPDYSYVPATVISLAVFADHLFVRPRANHYYFGDYYAPRYRDEGFHASFNYHGERFGYDPIYAHQRWIHRDERDWDRRRMERFNHFRDNEQARPPRTFAALLAGRAGVRDHRPDGNHALAERLDRYAERNPAGRRFQRVSADNRKRYIEQRQAVRNFSQERKKADSAAPRVAANQAARQRIQRSPVVGKRDAKAPARPKPQAAGKAKGGNERKAPAREDRGNGRSKQQPEQRGKEKKPAAEKRNEERPRNAKQRERTGKPERPAAPRKADAPKNPPKREARPEPPRKAAERKAPARKETAGRPAERQAAPPKARPDGAGNPARKNPGPGRPSQAKEKPDDEGAPKANR